MSHYNPFDSMLTGFFTNPTYLYIGVDGPTGNKVYNIYHTDIISWVEEQPIHMWKHYDVPKQANIFVNAFSGQQYLFTKEMESWFQLRWG
jgi:hypothetical protein